MMLHKKLAKPEYLGLAGGAILLLVLYLFKGADYVKSKFSDINIFSDRRVILPIIACSLIGIATWAAVRYG